MPINFFSLRLAGAACALTLGLSGCVAVPLAQLAASQMSAPKSSCLPGAACQADAPAGAFGDISKGVGDSFHKLTSLASDSQPSK